MKKNYNSIDLHQNHGHELSKKLYQTITEQSKRLDNARSCARSIEELFSPNLQIQRRKFCEYCERLIFSDPVLYGRKGEELLWRKGFYDIVAAAKKLKQNQYSQSQISNIQTHINAGIGFYHHYLSKLQSNYDLNLRNAIDFPVLSDVGVGKGDLKDDERKWASQSVHQSLIYLGDLSRYRLEIYPNWEPVVAMRYYLQAISYKPSYGMPHNQMGTLAMNQGNHLEAVYHYMRCLACEHRFEGTTNNLINLFAENSKYIEQLPQVSEDDNCIVEPSKSDQVKRFLARFLLLIDIWYFSKTVSKVYNLCHQTFKDLDECLTLVKPNSENGDTPTDTDSMGSSSGNSPSQLSHDILFKVTGICLLCISKLQSSNSQQVSTVVAFTLAIYSHLIQNVTNHIQVSVGNFPIPEQDPQITSSNGVGKKRHKLKLRRRKPAKAESDEDSDVSEDDASVSSDDSFISDADDTLNESSEDETDVTESSNANEADIKLNENKTPNQHKSEDSEVDQREEILKKVKKMDINDLLEIIMEAGLLQSVKILNDWLKQDVGILKSCGQNTKSLIRQLTFLLNLININILGKNLTGIRLDLKDKKQLIDRVPLTEDIALKGIDVLKKAQNDLDWEYLHRGSLSIKEESLIRVLKIVSFGKFISTISEVGVTYNEKEDVFTCLSVGSEEDRKTPSIIDLELEDTSDGPGINGIKPEGAAASAFTSATAAANTKGQLMKMKHMGQLWLAAEVRALENKVRGKASLSPYLVLDADALIKYTFMVKHLVHSRKFIVLVPTAVVSALDDLKRERPEARDAIRWLESQFHHGNRFFRAQRPQERASIPFIKYPKKKDKEMFIYIQIIECCHYLAEQQKGATNVVTLLIGNQNILNNADNKELSYVGLAKSAGVCIESITHFYGKWKKTGKENR